MTNKDKPSLMYIFEYTKREYETCSTVTLEEFLGCTIKCDLNKKTLNISQSHLIKKILKDLTMK